MLAALAASGQTPSAFARAKGFPPYRVSYWRAKLAVALHAPRQCSLQIGWQCGASQVAVPRPVGAYQAGAVGADSSVSRGAGA
jgi:hypothetical protein